MKITRVIHGEPFRYYVKLIPKTMTAEVKWWKADEPTICPISEDFKYITLPDTFTQFISGVGQVKVEKLKLNKVQQFEARDYNL